LDLGASTNGMGRGEEITKLQRKVNTIKLNLQSCM
jgi:hypothetical protein